MARNDWYIIYEEPTRFVVRKVDKDGDLKTERENPLLSNIYYIDKTDNTKSKLSNCSCFAGHTWCRHKKMLVKFQEKKRVGQSWRYNFDKDKWIEPPKLEA